MNSVESIFCPFVSIVHWTHWIFYTLFILCFDCIIYLLYIALFVKPDVTSLFCNVLYKHSYLLVVLQVVKIPLDTQTVSKLQMCSRDQTDVHLNMIVCTSYSALTFTLVGRSHTRCTAANTFTHLWRSIRTAQGHVDRDSGGDRTTDYWGSHVIMFSHSHSIRETTLFMLLNCGIASN